MICRTEDGQGVVFQARVQLDLMSATSPGVQHDGMVFDARPALDLEALLLRAFQREWIGSRVATHRRSILR